MPPPWQVIGDAEFDVWFNALPKDIQDAILVKVRLLIERGPALPRPHADTLRTNALANLKELRVQHKGQPWRIIFAFDKQRRAVLLIGGNKAGWKDNRWYEIHIPIAVARAQRHDIR